MKSTKKLLFLAVLIQYCRYYPWSSSETQGQLVGSIKCSWWKFTVRSRRAPGHLLLPNQFRKCLNCSLLIGQKMLSIYIYRSLLTWLRKMADAPASLQKVKNKILQRGARSIKGSLPLAGGNETNIWSTLFCVFRSKTLGFGWARVIVSHWIVVTQSH